MSFENGGAWGPIPTIFDENGACFLLNAYDCSQSVTLNLNVSFFVFTIFVPFLEWLFVITSCFFGEFPFYNSLYMSDSAGFFCHFTG